MSSNTQPSQKLRRNGSPSTNKSSGPLRATIPVSLMSQSVIHDLPEDSHPTNSSQSVWNKTNLPHTVVGTGNTLQCGIQKLTPLGLKMRQWSPVKGICGFLIAYNSWFYKVLTSLNVYFSGESWAPAKDWWLSRHEDNCFSRCHLSERLVAQRNSRLRFKSTTWQSHTNSRGMDGWFKEVIHCHLYFYLSLKQSSIHFVLKVLLPRCRVFP